MFACLYSLSAPVAALVKVAEEFTPRFEVVGPLVMLDVGGLSRLFGSAHEIGEQLRRAAMAPVRIALAPTQTAAALLALGRPGLVVIAPDGQRVALAPLTVSVLGEFERVRLGARPRGCPHPPPPGNNCTRARARQARALSSPQMLARWRTSCRISSPASFARQMLPPRRIAEREVTEVTQVAWVQRVHSDLSHPHLLHPSHLLHLSHPSHPYHLCHL